MYYSLVYLDLADATVITFLSPGLACWACSILINEPFTRIEQIAGLISLVGVTLIARPVTLFAAFGGSDSPPATGNSDAMPVTNATAPAVGGPDAANSENVSPEQRLMAVGIRIDRSHGLGGRLHYDTLDRQACPPPHQRQLLRRMVHSCQHRHAVRLARRWLPAARRFEGMGLSVLLGYLRLHHGKLQHIQQRVS